MNNLGKYEYSEPLFFLLVKKIEQDKIKLIFKDLLNLNQHAQSLMLKSLLLDEVSNLPSSFEMFVTLKIIIDSDNTLAQKVFDKVNFQKQPITN